MNIFFHIAKLQDWERGKVDGEYRADTFESLGFIHCSLSGQLIEIANKFYKGQTDLVLLCIDPFRVHAEIKYEASQGAESYPHIYGPLNTDAVINVLSFEPNQNGKFRIPDEIAQW